MHDRKEISHTLRNLDTSVLVNIACYSYDKATSPLSKKKVRNVVKYGEVDEKNLKRRFGI